MNFYLFLLKNDFWPKFFSLYWDKLDFLGSIVYLSCLHGICMDDIQCCTAFLKEVIYVSMYLELFSFTSSNFCVRNMCMDLCNRSMLFLYHVSFSEVVCEFWAADLSRFDLWRMNYIHYVQRKNYASVCKMSMFWHFNFNVVCIFEKLKCSDNAVFQFIN